MADSGRRGALELEELAAGVRAVPRVRYFQASAGPPVRGTARRNRHRGGRPRGGRVRGACVIRRRMVQSVLGPALSMAFRKSPGSHPQIENVTPAAAIPGGEFRIRGKGLTTGDRALARFGEMPAHVVVGSDSL